MKINSLTVKEIESLIVLSEIGQPIELEYDALYAQKYFLEIHIDLRVSHVRYHDDTHENMPLSNKVFITIKSKFSFSIVIGGKKYISEFNKRTGIYVVYAGPVDEKDVPHPWIIHTISIGTNNISNNYYEKNIDIYGKESRDYLTSYMKDNIPRDKINEIFNKYY